MINQIAEIVEEQCKKESNRFGYGAWQYHIVPVVKYAKLMAQKTGADQEIVELAALLHDYASVKDYDLYKEHHLYGAEEAEKILNKFNYPQGKIEQVKKCILSHRGSVELVKESKEALALADADSMAHFDFIASLFHLAFCSYKMDINQAENWLFEKLTRSFNKLSEQAKEIIRPKFEAAKLLLSRRSD